MTAAIGPVSITVDDWVAEKRASVPDFLEFSPAPGLRARALVAFTQPDDPSLVPVALRARLQDPLPAPRRTRLGGAPAWTYLERRLADGRLMDVTVAPTTLGVLTVACTAPEREWSAGRGCAAGVRKVSIGDARPLAPADDLALRARAPAVIERLNERRTELRRRLARATTVGGQARFATRLSRAYARAASELAGVAPAAGEPAGVVALLTRASGAYDRLAVAARARWPKRHRMARKAVKKTDRALRRALTGLRR